MKRSKLKLVIISTVASIHTVRWARYFAEKGFDVTIISSHAKNSPIPGVKIVECLSRPYHSYLRHLYHQLSRAIAVKRILSEIRPDIVHIHSFDYIHPLMIGIVNLICDGFQNLIVSTWGSDVVSQSGEPFSRRGVFSKRFLLKQAKEITATSHYLARTTVRLAPPGKKVNVIPFGVDCSLFSLRNKKKESPTVTVGFIKHLAPQYGPDYLMRAMKIVFGVSPQSRLIIVGDGPMEGELKEIAKHSKIDKRVEFRGRLPHSKIPEVLKEFDIFVMPSLVESFGVAAIEAQAMEVPVVATNVGGIPEVVLHGETGLLVEARNVTELAKAITHLIENPKLRRVMGEKGREFVLSRYRWQDNAASMGRLYLDLCKAQ